MVMKKNIFMGVIVENQNRQTSFVHLCMLLLYKEICRFYVLWSVLCFCLSYYTYIYIIIYLFSRLITSEIVEIHVFFYSLLSYL